MEILDRLIGLLLDPEVFGLLEQVYSLAFTLGSLLATLVALFG